MAVTATVVTVTGASATTVEVTGGIAAVTVDVARGLPGSDANVTTANVAAAGAAMKANNLSDLASASTARTNLGLGTSATTDTGTGASNTILGNDARLTDARTPTAHASTHALGGSDPMAPGDIGAAYEPDAAKATALVDADKFYIYDSANGLAPRTSLWSIIKSTLKTYFDTLYPSGSGTSSGTNTGDQTSIVGITGTTAQFNTALTDGDFATLAGSETLTNKRITPRITTIVSSGTPTINTDNCDCVTITALAAAITSMTTNLSGTPSNFDQLVIRIKDNATARAITWGASFVARGGILPTTTVISKVWTVLFIYNSVSSTWDCVSSSLEV